MTDRPIPAITGFNPFGALDEEKDPTEEAKRERENAQAEIDQHFLNTFSSPSGKVVWEYLCARTERVEGFTAERGLFDGIAWGFAREGQNSIIRFCRERMMMAIKRQQEKGT